MQNVYIREITWKQNNNVEESVIDIFMKARTKKI